jgi:hypothetical protein
MANERALGVSLSMRCRRGGSWPRWPSRRAAAAGSYDLGLVRQNLPELIKDHKPKSLGWFPNGPTAAPMADLLIMKGVK